MPGYATRSSVLLADLAPMVGAGMIGMLSDRGIEVVVAGSVDDLGETVQLMRPFAVVLDLDGTQPRELTALVRGASPQTKVVLWARREDVMEVIDPGASSPRFVLGSSPAQLCDELSINHPSPPRGPELEEPPCPTT